VADAAGDDLVGRSPEISWLLEADRPAAKVADPGDRVGAASVLPAPFGPMTATISPATTSASMPCNISVRPYPDANLFDGEQRRG